MIEAAAPFAAAALTTDGTAGGGTPMTTISGASGSASQDLTAAMPSMLS